MKSRFTEMYHILDALRSKNLLPALDWARRHRVELERKDSHLEFHLHRLQFVSLLTSTDESQKRISNALVYAKKEFGIFGSKYMKGKLSFA